MSNTDGDDAGTVKDVYEAQLSASINIGTCTIDGTNGIIGLPDANSVETVGTIIFSLAVQ